MGWGEAGNGHAAGRRADRDPHTLPFKGYTPPATGPTCSKEDFKEGRIMILAERSLSLGFIDLFSPQK